MLNKINHLVLNREYKILLYNLIISWNSIDVDGPKDLSDGLKVLNSIKHLEIKLTIDSYLMTYN